MPERKKIDWLSDKILGRLHDQARQGATLEEMAKDLECGLSTLKNNQTKYKTVRDAIKKGRALSSTYLRPIVESALITSIKGGYVTETKTKRKWEEVLVYDKANKPVLDKNGKQKTIKTSVEVTEDKHKKFIPASVTAQIFWLCNKTEDYSSINQTGSQVNIDDIQSEFDVVKGLHEE